MKRYVLLLVLLVPLLGGFTSCVSSQGSRLTRKFSPEQLKEDATLLKNVILEMHPAVGIYKPREYYDRVFTDFVNELKDSLTEKEFRLRTKLVVDKLHCGHTEVLYSSAFYREVNRQKWNYSPYVFLPVKDKVFMIANLNKKDSSLRKGVQVTRINGVPVDSMLRHTRRFISSDGYNTTGKYHYAQLGFNSYYLGLFGRPDTFKVEYLQNGLKKEVSYSAIKLKNLPSLPLGPRTDSLYKNYRYAKIKYRFLEEDKKTMMMQIEKFSHNQDGYAYKRIFRKLKKNRSENLIIDLRNNGGGSLSNCYRLLSYLIDTPATQTLRTTVKNYPYKKYTRGNLAFKVTRLAYMVIGTRRSVNDTDYFIYTIRPRQKNHFNGKIFVLINGGSFSASCLVAAYLRNNSRAVFVGEETGGAREGCNAGITPFYKLPNSAIRVRVPAFRIIHDVSPAATGQGIFPDYAVEYSLKDIMTRKDLELAKVKEMLNIR
jgi:hypothetical protein